MPTLSSQLTEIVRKAAIDAGYGDAPIAVDPCVPTNNAEHGDYQSNHAFRLGKALKTNPRVVAEKIVAALGDPPLVERASVAGPGFINFRLRDRALADDVAARATDPSLGVGRSGEGRTMVIDYSSPNIAKRMHVGHMRSTIIGNAIDRLHRFLGWTVIADNHIGDWGTQFGKLIVAWHRWRDDAAFAADPIGELQRIYQRFAEEEKADPALIELARAETVKLQHGDAENRALWQRFVDASLREFEQIYTRMGVRFDVVLGESFYRDRLDALVDDLLARGVATVNEGATIIPFGEGDDADLHDKPMLIRKSDGAALYGTTDLATVLHRRDTWAPRRVVYVTDVRQQLHFRQLFAAARKLGVTDVEFVHVWFGMLKFADGQIAASRTGAVINLRDVLDVAVERARRVVDEKSAELPESERAAIAEAVGIGAIKYADLSQNPQTDIVFEWDKMLAMDGNTAPYLMYAYARCKSIFRKAGLASFTPGGVVVDHPAERELAVMIARTPEVIENAAAAWRPNLLCDHLFGVANTFARFYGACRVLGDDVAPETTQSRLTLVHATAHALGVGLDLLGLRALDRM